LPSGAADPYEWIVEESPARAQSAAEPGAWATHVALLIVQVAFAAQAVEAKIAMAPIAAGGEGVSPSALAMTRMLGAGVFFQVYARATGKLVKTSWRDQLWLAGLSMMGIVLNQVLFLAGLALTTPMTAALLAVTIPVLAAGMAVAIRHEVMSAKLALGLGLAIAGVVSLTGIHSVDVGAVVVLLNCLSYAAYIVFSRTTIKRLGALTVIAWLFAWGAVLFAPIGAFALVSNAPGWSHRAWAFVAFIVLVPTIIAYLSNAWALGRSSATLVTAYIYLQPALCAALAWVQLGQGLTARHGIAAALIVLGVGVVASRGPARSAVSAESAGVEDAT
jgi:drug/metabolite transporter (DMT)-like permease